MAQLLVELLKIPFYYLLELFYFITRCRPKKEIKNQDILITGAAQGIGAEFARKFSEMGNRVHLVDVNEEMLVETVDSLNNLGFEAYPYVCDLTMSEQVQSLFDGITSAGFTISVLVNNAGVAFGTPLTEMSLTQIQHSLSVNITASLWLIKLFLPKMLEINEGHVVNIASMAGKFPLIDSTDYCAAKAGSIHTMNQLRSQHCSTNVKFTAVCPWFVDTKMITGIDPSSVAAVSPQHVVAVAVKGVRENKEDVYIPRHIKTAITLLRAVLPSPTIKALTVIKNSQVSMRNYEGQRMVEKIK